MKDFLKGLVLIGLFAIPFIPLIVTDSMFFPFITGKNFSFRIIVEVIFGAWALLALLDAAYRPRFSWILSGASVLLVVMFFANILGEFPLKSFWSNFERMDGYVTLIHFFLYFVVLASMLRDDKKLWCYYLWTTVAAAGYAAFDGLQQALSGEGSWRVDSTLGNAAYMAIYMLFHVFFTVYLFVQSKQWWTRGILTVLFALFVTILILTSTRGTFIGLVAGLGVTVLYLLIFARAYPMLRKVALGAIVVLLLVIGGFYANKDATFIQESPVLKRLANISVDDLSVRFDIWGMAYEGFKERPILGWGQGNFNYVFNKEYDPDLYFAESWYDRAHNVALDWLTAGGILGFLAYLSIFFALAYYLLVRPHRKSEEDVPESQQFTVAERAVLIGLIVAYFTHNLVVFDNIVSFIFFGVTIALIHGRISTPIKSVDEFELDPRIVTNIATPVVVVFTGAVVYFVNIPGITASTSIIDALTASTIPERLDKMEEAIAVDSFAYQEIVEQLAQQAMQIAANPNIPNEAKGEFIQAAERELLNLAQFKPGDARVHVFIAGFYRNIGDIEAAKEHIDIARSLSPTKQAIILEQGIIAFQRNDYEAMHDYFKEAFELQTENRQARTFYATSLMYIDRADEVDALLETERQFEAFAENDFALQSANRFSQIDLMMRIFEERIENNPENAQQRASLAFLKYQEGDMKGAVEVLEAGVDAVPSFAELGTCYIENIEAGDPPQEGCDPNATSAN